MDKLISCLVTILLGMIAYVYAVRTSLNIQAHIQVHHLTKIEGFQLILFFGACLAISALSSFFLTNTLLKWRKLDKTKRRKRLLINCLWFFVPTSTYFTLFLWINR